MNTRIVCYKRINIKTRAVFLKSRKYIGRNREQKGKYECGVIKENKKIKIWPANEKKKNFHGNYE